MTFPSIDLEATYRSWVRSFKLPRPIEQLWSPDEEARRRDCIASFDAHQTAAYQELLSIGDRAALDMKWYFQFSETPYPQYRRLVDPLDSRLEDSGPAKKVRCNIECLLRYLGADLPWLGKGESSLAAHEADLFAETLGCFRSRNTPQCRSRLAVQCGVERLPDGLPAIELGDFEIVALAKQKGLLEPLLRRKRTRAAVYAIALKYGLVDGEPSVFLFDHEVAARLSIPVRQFHRYSYILFAYLEDFPFELPL